MNQLQRLILHSDWANRTWLEFTFGDAGGEAYLARIISHVYLAEQVWFQRIYGEEVDKDIFTTRTPDELRELMTSHQSRYADIAVRDLNRIIAFRRFTGEALESTIQDILLHLITHGAHHRGQMAAFASQSQLVPPNTDYLTFSRLSG